MWLNWWGFASASDDWPAQTIKRNIFLLNTWFMCIIWVQTTLYQSEWQYSSCQRHWWRVSTNQSRLLIKLLSIWRDRRAPEPRLNKTARLPVNKMAGSCHVNRSSQCPWEKRLDMFDTGQTQNLCCQSWLWSSRRRRLIAVPQKKKIQYFNISLSIIWRHQEPAAGEKCLISSVTSEKKKKKLMR